MNRSTKNNSRKRKARDSSSGSDSDDDDLNITRQRPKRQKLTPKWKTLNWKHGPLFPPKPSRLPASNRLKYKNRFVNLSTKAEEGARFFAKIMEIKKYVNDSKFRSNFFQSWRRDWMDNADRKTILEMKYCDFTLIQKYLKENKNRNSAETCARWKRTHGSCIVDGKEQSIGNFRIESPGLFIGRGNHPHRGCIKQRVYPKDVTINCSKGGEPKGKQWKAATIIHDPSSSWLAKYSNTPEFGCEKYILLTPDSNIRTKSDKSKYEKARELGKYISKIKRDYERDLKSKNEEERQRGVVLYLIHKCSFRIGHEKGSNEADTVGCCTLRREHITIKGQTNLISFDFLGKDSIRFKDTVRVPTDVYRNLRALKTKGPNTGKLFDLLTPSSLNNHLKSYMSGLSAKVFRTYNASLTLEKHLGETNMTGKSVEEQLKYFNAGNRKIAKLCNHQKPSTNKNSMLKNVNRKIKLKERDFSRARKELRRLKQGTTQFNKMIRRRDKCKTDLSTLKSKKKEMIDNAGYAFSTSKANYIDPRIVVKWCKKNNVPIKKIYSPQLQRKFRWAIEGRSSTVFKF